MVTPCAKENEPSGKKMSLILFFVFLQRQKSYKSNISLFLSKVASKKAKINSVKSLLMLYVHDLNQDTHNHHAYSVFLGKYQTFSHGLESP